jgi:hypothetical protein
MRSTLGSTVLRSHNSPPTRFPTRRRLAGTRIVGLVTRRAAYNTVLNFRPRRSRWRPYISAGPVFQLLSLSNAPLKKPSGYFRLGLTNIGLVKAAFDFGSVAPSMVEAFFSSAYSTVGESSTEYSPG